MFKIRNCKNCGEEFSHRANNAKFCSINCNQAYCDAKPHRQYKKKLRKSPYIIHKKDKCEHCGFIPLHPCQLDVDHIDENHLNNDSSNLQTLCANCHRLKSLLNKKIKNKRDKR